MKVIFNYIASKYVFYIVVSLMETLRSKWINEWIKGWINEWINEWGSDSINVLR